MSTASTAEPQVRIPRSANPVPTSPRRPSRALPVPVYAAGALVLVAALIVGAKQVGWFATSGRVDGEGKAITLTTSSTGGDIKGWMTLQQVIDGFGVSKAELYAAFGIPASVSTDTGVGPLGEEVEGFDVPTLRAWIDARG